MTLKRKWAERFDLMNDAFFPDIFSSNFKKLFCFNINIAAHKLISKMMSMYLTALIFSLSKFNLQNKPFTPLDLINCIL